MACARCGNLLLLYPAVAEDCRSRRSACARWGVGGGFRHDPLEPFIRRFLMHVLPKGLPPHPPLRSARQSVLRRQHRARPQAAVPNWRPLPPRLARPLHRRGFPEGGLGAREGMWGAMKPSARSDSREVQHSASLRHNSGASDHERNSPPFGSNHAAIRTTEDQPLSGRARRPGHRFDLAQVQMLVAHRARTCAVQCCDLVRHRALPISGG
jgi:hypothetical protein